jgi:hypothetical protein
VENVREDVRMRRVYEPPKVLATYSKEELALAIRPHGSTAGYSNGCGGGCGCGCGCGCS